MAKTYITDPAQIPPYMMDALNAYIDEGVTVGDFLQAVICNNLKDAVGRADSVNINLLPAYIIYLYNEAPSLCWGTPGSYQAWLAFKDSQRNLIHNDAAADIYRAMNADEVDIFDKIGTLPSRLTRDAVVQRLDLFTIVMAIRAIHTKL